MRLILSVEEISEETVLRSTVMQKVRNVSVDIVDR